MVLRASGNIISAPASENAIALSTADSIPSKANASVLAIITKLGSVLASTAALIRSSISLVLTIALFGRCPQRF